MADDLNPNPDPTPVLMGNNPEARNPDGSLKTPTPSPSPSPEPTPEPSKEPVKVEGAPEKYADFTAPEGYELDEELVGKIAPVFKELNLTQEQAQKLVNFYGETALEIAEAPYKTYETMREGWRSEIVKDAEIGNGKDDLKPEVSAAIDGVFNLMPAQVADGFRKALSMTGAGDNPDIIRGWVALTKIPAIAQLVKEGTPILAGGPSPGGQKPAGQQPQSAGAVLYPHLPSTAR